ncbi:hypothetical protein BGW38_004522 [Lunasporangiospora selenospora]|uniref:Uncharacterized protein n=1 Tax=Lunasporangiospora selenospora TaxID=979761 RepID=A0A9P6KC35_9FUNG|nr:hypothetical protein BGW38_004522 [Lunasporangiospora selenospora]
MTSPSFENILPANTTSETMATTSTTTPAPASGSGLGRRNTLKAYLANKNKLKERNAINIIVNPSVLHENPPLSSSPEKDSMLSPQPTSPDGLFTQQLIQLSNPSSPTATSPTSTAAAAAAAAEAFGLVDLDSTALSPMASKEELKQQKAQLCQDLDEVMKQRRALLQSWARDYKNLKRSGSLAKRQDDLFWVTTA